MAVQLAGPFPIDEVSHPLSRGHREALTGDGTDDINGWKSIPWYTYFYLIKSLPHITLWMLTALPPTAPPPPHPPLSPISSHPQSNVVIKPYGDLPILGLINYFLG